MSIYLEHFGLREAPFRITPHTEFFFAGGNRGATLDALIYAVSHDEGIIKVTGEVGSGKTMLCRMLVERAPAEVETIFLANPSLSRDEILFSLADELGIPEPPTRVHHLLRTIQQRLVELFAAGKRVVLLIDEAHAMPAPSLEEIRLLSNLESNRHKLLQIVLFGQPELNDLLAQAELRQLRERITQNFELEPLRRPDVGSYIIFRLRAAGYHGPDPFTPASIQLIAQASAGLTRRINILADKSLLAAFSNNSHAVDTAQAKAAIRDAKFGPMPKPAHVRGGARRNLAAGAFGALFVAGGIAWFLLEGHLASGTTPTAGSAPTANAAQLAPTKIEAENPPPKTSPPAVAAPPPPPGPAPAAVAAVNVAVAAPADANSRPPVPAASPPPAEPTSSPRRLEGQLQAFTRWLPQADDERFFIQLLRTRGDSERQVEAFIEANRKGLDPDQLRVYRSSLNGQEWIGVIYGEYASREEASAAIRGLPATARTSSPYPRAVRMLR